MKIRVLSFALAAVLLILTAATGGCESTPLLAPSNAALTLLASPATAAPIPALDPSEDTYFSTIIGQLLSGGSASETGGASGATPLAGRNITFVTSAGILARCSSETSCSDPVPGPATVETNSSGVVYVRLGVTKDDPDTVSLQAISGSISGTVSVNNPLGEPNDEAEAILRIVPESPADASSGSVDVTFISESTDPDGDPITCFSWYVAGPEFVVNRISREESISENYTAEQRLSAILKVSSDSDAEDVCDSTTNFSPNIDAQEYLICTNTVPVAVIQQLGQSNEPSQTTATFSGSNSSDTESSIALYEWDCGNGTEQSGVEIGCTYTRTSTTRYYTVELVVTDRGNGEADCAYESTPASTSVEVLGL